jgi:hypothetical protein
MARLRFSTKGHHVATKERLAAMARTQSARAGKKIPAKQSAVEGRAALSSRNSPQVGTNPFSDIQRLGTVACASTFAVTLPSSILTIPLRPWDAITMNIAGFILCGSDYRFVGLVMSHLHGLALHAGGLRSISYLIQN